VDRLFLDANVLFSAAWRPGAGVARLWRVPGAVLFTSAFTAEEAARNLSGPGQQERLIQHLQPVRIKSEVNNVSHLQYSR
jgi:hypothetical protein